MSKLREEYERHRRGEKGIDMSKTRNFAEVIRKKLAADPVLAKSVDIEMRCAEILTDAYEYAVEDLRKDYAAKVEQAVREIETARDIIYDGTNESSYAQEGVKREIFSCCAEIIRRIFESPVKGGE